MRPKFIITLAVISIAFIASIFAFRFLSGSEFAFWKAEGIIETTENIIAGDDPIIGLEMPAESPEGIEDNPPEQIEGDLPEPEYDYSAPGQVFVDIEKIKEEYTGRHDYRYDQRNVELAKNFGIYQTGKKNPFSEIYSLNEYNFDKSVIIPNEASNN